MQGEFASIKEPNWLSGEQRKTEGPRFDGAIPLGLLVRF
jgi:hypothetical protein